MEFYYILFGYLLFCFIIAKTVKKFQPNNNSKLPLPPGPVPFPIIGNGHLLSGGQTHVILKDLAAKHGPLMHLKIGEVSTIIVSSPEIASHIFKTHDIVFADRPSNLLAFKIASYNFLDMVGCPYGNYWRKLRKICMTELLSIKRVQSFRSVREEEVLNLVKSIFLKSGSVINVTKMIFSSTFGITAVSAFGKRNKYQEEFIRLEDELTKAASEFCIADMFPSLKFLGFISLLRYKVQKIHEQMDEIAENILNEHKENYIKGNIGEQKEDLVDVLLNIQRRGDFETPFTDRSIKALIFVSQILFFFFLTCCSLCIFVIFFTFIVTIYLFFVIYAYSCFINFHI